MAAADGGSPWLVYSLLWLLEEEEQEETQYFCRFLLPSPVAVVVCSIGESCAGESMEKGCDCV